MVTLIFPAKLPLATDLRKRGSQLELCNGSGTLKYSVFNVVGSLQEGSALSSIEMSGRELRRPPCRPPVSDD